MLFFLNGRFVPEEQAVVSVLDRGFLYGDGLFETILIHQGKPFRWDQHFARLEQGAGALKIPVNFESRMLRSAAEELARHNQMSSAFLRLTVSRGCGPRGYSPRGADQPTIVMSLHPSPRIPDKPIEWNVVTSNVRLPAGDPLARFKTCNKLAQVLARSEAELAGGDEALLLNSEGHVVEGAGSNLFWIAGGTVMTPPLTGGILPGVTRAVILELCRSLKLESREEVIALRALMKTEAVFLSLSTLGVVAVRSIDGVPLQPSAVVDRLHAAYWDCVRSEIEHEH